MQDPSNPSKNAGEYTRGVQDGRKLASLATSDEGPLTSLLAPLLVFGLPCALAFWMLRRGSGFGVGKSMGRDPMQDLRDMMNPFPARSFRVDVTGTTLKDVVGIPEALEEIRQYVDFLKTPSKFTRLGARLPKGCLLTGEPGTGKTLLAKAVASEASVPFFSCNGADFIELVGGSGPKRVRDLFEDARKNAPSIVFIDEIDAIGSRHGGQRNTSGSMSSEENRTINQLLAELDGLASSADAVVVMAATNLQDNVDKALLREGRFDRKIPIDVPDLAARRDVFQHYLNRVSTGDPLSPPPSESNTSNHKNATSSTESSSTTTSSSSTDSLQKNKKPPNTSVSVSASATSSSSFSSSSSQAPDRNKEWSHHLAQLTPGLSPAAIANIVNEAALQAGIQNKPLVELRDLHQVIDDNLLGKKIRNRMTADGIRRTAIHESGHALCTWMLPQQKQVLKVSVQPRGNALGYTQKAGTEHHEYQTNATIFTDLIVLLGGRAAEEVVVGQMSTGAADDLQRATDMLMKALLAFGMGGEVVGLLAFNPDVTRAGRSFVPHSEATQRIAEDVASVILAEAHHRAQSLVKTHQEKLLLLTEELIKKEELVEEDVAKIFGPRPTTPTALEIANQFEEILKKARSVASSNWADKMGSASVSA